MRSRQGKENGRSPFLAILGAKNGWEAGRQGRDRGTGSLDSVFERKRKTERKLLRVQGHTTPGGSSLVCTEFSSSTTPLAMAMRSAVQKARLSMAKSTSGQDRVMGQCTTFQRATDEYWDTRMTDYQEQRGPVYRDTSPAWDERVDGTP
jgi:hypothetical protein